MRLVLLVTLLGGCGVGFDGDPEPNTPAECIKAGGTVRKQGKDDVCDLPASGGYVAAQNARARVGDAGAQD